MDEPQHVQIGLRPTNDGGLKEPMPLPTTSLILVFNSLDTESQDEVQIGARIASAGQRSIAPGLSFRGTVDFWADLGYAYAKPGVSFRLWYAGRIVGSGRFEPDDTPGTTAA